MSGTDPLSPLPFGADGGAPKLAGRRRHHGLGVGGQPGDEMPAAAMTGEGGRRRRRHTARGGVDAGRRRKHSRRAGQDAAPAAVAGRRRKHSRRAGESAAVSAVSAGRRRRHTRKH